MLKTLLKKQMAEIFRSYFYDQKKNKKRSVLSSALYIILFVLLMVGFVGGFFTYFSVTICTPLTYAGMGWLYFAITGIIAILLGTFGSVFNTYSGLYLSKDNDLLLSMPIPASAIIASRLLSVYLMGLMYSAVVTVPAVAVYWMSVPVNAGIITGGILLVLMISVIVLVLSCILGFAVAKISLKLKNKSFVSLFVSILFVGLYYFFYFNAQSLISELIANAAVYGTKIKSYAYPLYIFGRTGEGDIPAIAASVAFSLIISAVTWRMLEKSFIKIAVSSGKNSYKKQKRENFKSRSMFRAILSKEFTRFTSSSTYMLNCGFGILLLPVCGSLLIIKGSTFIEMLNLAFPSQNGVSVILLCASVCLLSSMNDMAAPSVSLEGKSLWLIQSLPVPAFRVLCAKASVQFILTLIPAALCSACAIFVLKCTFLQSLLFIVFITSFVLLSALFNVFIGLKLPNLTWTNEIAPIKQSLGVAIAIFACWIYSAAFFVLYMVSHMELCAYLVLSSAVTFVLAFIIYTFLKNKGSRIFSSL